MNFAFIIGIIDKSTRKRQHLNEMETFVMLANTATDKESKIDKKCNRLLTPADFNTVYTIEPRALHKP